jgi:signal peptidase I
VKEVGRINDLITAATFALLFALCLGFAAIRVLGFGSYIVTGGSMEPAIHKGALVLIEPVSPTEVNVGDVITFQQYDQTTTHRVIEITRTAGGLSFKTQGDANTVADPEDKTFAGSVGIVRVSVPLAGYVVASVQAYWRLVLTLIAAAIFFSCAGVLVFGSKTSTAAMPKPRALRAVRVTVDPDAAWQAHLAWLERSRLEAVGLR